MDKLILTSLSLECTLRAELEEFYKLHTQEGRRIVSYDPGAFPPKTEVSVWHGNCWRYGVVQSVVQSNEGTYLRVHFQGAEKPEEISLDQSVQICNVGVPVEETLPRQNGRK